MSFEQHSKLTNKQSPKKVLDLLLFSSIHYLMFQSGGHLIHYVGKSDFLHTHFSQHEGTGFCTSVSGSNKLFL